MRKVKVIIRQPPAITNAPHNWWWVVVDKGPTYTMAHWVGTVAGTNMDYLRMFVNKMCSTSTTIRERVNHA